MEWWSEPGPRSPAPSVFDALDLGALAAHPHLPAILVDLRSVEALLRRWWPRWPVGEPTEAACAQLLAVAQAQLAPLVEMEAPPHDLTLLAGLLAIYQHHRGAPRAAALARRHLSRALQRAPDDTRILWLLGTLDAFSGRVEAGMWTLLRVASAGQGPRRHSPAFWLDYAEVALLADMPGHAAWALDKVPGGSPALPALRGALAARTRRSRPADQLPAALVWRPYPGEQPRWISHLLGLHLAPPPGWTVEPGPWALGRGTLGLRSPPLPGRGGPVQARIALAVAPALASAEELIRAWFGPLRPAPLPCPLPGALAFAEIDAARYPTEGGGLLQVVVQRAEEPRAPGLGIELPQALAHGDQPGAEALPAEPIPLRLPGPLWVVVALDVAASVAPAATPGFVRVLQRLLLDGA